MKIITFAKYITFTLALFFMAIVITGILQVSPASVSSLFISRDFFSAILFTFKTSVAATFLAFVMGVPAGFFLARKRSMLSMILDALFDLPIVIPPLIVGVLLLTFFNIPFVREVYPFIFTISGAIVAQFFIAFPFVIKSSKSSFEMVSPIYGRIAMTLGASPIKSFYDTTFKMAFPGILSGVVLTWLRCVGEFGATLMVGGGITGVTENIPVHIYVNMTSGDFEKGLAVSVISIAIAFICVIVVKIFFKNKGKILKSQNVLQAKLPK